MLNPVQRRVETQATCLRTDDPETLTRFAPDVVVLAEHFRDHLRALIPDAEIVWTRHGLAGKNYVAESLRHCDYACLSSEWSREAYAERGWAPRKASWITGFVPMDALYDRAREPRRDPRPHLLYAPTHNENLSSLRALPRDWPLRLREALPELRITFKPHPHSIERDPLSIARLRALTERDEALRLIEGDDVDIYPLLADVDVLFTDASSVMFYFLALDRPVVLYTHPRRADNPERYDPDAIEWRWRDLGEEIDSVEGLIAAVRRGLDEPHARSSIRREYARRLLGDTFDGGAAERVARHVLSLDRA